MRTSQHVEADDDIPFPENQEFYYGEQKDVWQENEKQAIKGVKKRTADEREVDMLSDAAGGEQAWKVAMRQTASALDPNMFPPLAEETKHETAQTVKQEPSHEPAKVSTATASTDLNALSSVEKEESEKRMQNAVQIVHKLNGEWNRKKREFNLVVAKSSLNKFTMGSAVESTLKNIIKEGTELADGMDEIETLYAIGKVVDTKRLQDMKDDADKVYTLIRSGNKMKFTDWGQLKATVDKKQIDRFASFANLKSS